MIRSTPCGQLFLFYNIAYNAELFNRYLQILEEIRDAIRDADAGKKKHRIHFCR